MTLKFKCTCEKEFSKKKYLIENIKDGLLLRTHKYPLICHQPECNNNIQFDSVDQLVRHLKAHEKESTQQLFQVLPTTRHLKANSNANNSTNDFKLQVTNQPLIVQLCNGQLFIIDSTYIAFGSSNFTYALDIYVKCFRVLNVKYPE